MSGFATDRSGGASGVAGAFLRELERWSSLDRSPDAATFRSALYAWLRGAQIAQPSMALVHQLAARALSVVETGVARGDGAADLRGHLTDSCRVEREDLARSIDDVARTAAALVPDKGRWIATLSSSATVRAALVELHRLGRSPRVLVAEGRPNLEGREMASALAAAGIPVWLVVDAALPLLLGQAAGVWLGADAVTERGVLNKIGSYAAALAAREHGVPVYALAGRRRFIPGTTSALVIDEMPPAEVWADPATNVQPRNVYFEIVPLELLRGVVVEDGVIGAGEVGIACADRALPDDLERAPTRA